jgi:hypothetical protein
MSEDKRNWECVLQSKIREDGENVVTIPEPLFDEGGPNILNVGEPASWSYDRSGFVLISNLRLTDTDPKTGRKKYEFVASNNIDSSRVTRVPGRFFSDYEGHHGPISEPDLKYEPRFRYGQKVFFAYYEGMASPEGKKSCFMMTEPQLLDVMGGESHDLLYGSVPSFI